MLIHPELHRMLSNEARCQGFSIQEQMHEILCLRFDRTDLLTVNPTPLSAVS